MCLLSVWIEIELSSHAKTLKNKKKEVRILLWGQMRASKKTDLRRAPMQHLPASEGFHGSWLTKLP